MASPGSPISVNGTADSTLWASTKGSGCVYGICVAERAGNAATFNVRAVTSAGQIVIPVNLAANESKTLIFPFGILFDRGVFEDWLTGAYIGTVIIGDG